MSLEELRVRPAGEPRHSQPGSMPKDALDPERWLEDHGDVLFSFALLRVRDRATAQDLVQETFLAALKAIDRFAGRSTERAWLFGILRNKLVDHYRRQSREMALADAESAAPEEDGLFHAAGLGKDGWIHRLAPQRWEAPDESLVSGEFQGVFQECVSGLPDKVAQVFLRREIDDLPSEEICKEFGISQNNLWVMLHRARMALRRCLEVNWFGNKRPEK
jgi:RNA polymerase sigma-70 factor, ECF subfamily